MSATTNCDNRPSPGWREVLVGYVALMAWCGLFWLVFVVAGPRVWVAWLMVVVSGLAAVSLGLASKWASNGSRKEKYFGAFCWGSVIASLLCVLAAVAIRKGEAKAQAKVREFAEAAVKNFSEEVTAATLNCWDPCIVKEKELNSLRGGTPEDLRKFQHILSDLETKARESRDSLNKTLDKWRFARTENRDDARSKIFELADRNVALFDDYIAVTAEIREWTYSAQVLAKRTSSGEVAIESFLRGMNGDPLGTYKEWRGQHDEQTIVLMRLGDRWDQVFKRRKAAFQDFVQWTERDKERTVSPSRP